MIKKYLNHAGSKRNSAQDTSNTSSNDIFSKCPICQRDVSSRGRSKIKPMIFHQQMTFCKDHQVKDAETEWAHRGYPLLLGAGYIFDWRFVTSLIQFASTIVPDCSSDVLQVQSQLRSPASCRLHSSAHLSRSRSILI